MQDTELPEKIEPISFNFQTELAENISNIAPEAMSDGKLDVTKLRELMNGDAENSPEKFGLFWPGKRAAQALAQIPTTATLIPAPEESVDWENTKNIFIEGDNLEVLKTLQNSYRRKVKMIYIDPPYNTGNEFIYPDKFSEGLQGYLEYTGQKNKEGENLESKQETGGRKHSNWLSMLYPRLQLAKSLLTDDGIIVVSIDHNEFTNLQFILNEVFGESNQLGIISVVNNLKGRSDDNNFATSHEYLCVFARNAEKVRLLGLQISEEEISDDYESRDEFGDYKLIGFRKTGKGWERKHRPYMFYPVFYKNEEFSTLPKDKLVHIYDKITQKFDDAYLNRIVEEHTNGGFSVFLPTDGQGNEGRWRWGIETFNKQRQTELGFNNAGSLCTKMRATLESGELRLKKAKTLWYKPQYDTGSAGKTLNKLFKTTSTYFENPKSVHLIKDILDTNLGRDDIVLDFFSGSGTTSHAVMELNAEDDGNRVHIQVQLPEITDIESEAFKAGYVTISNITKERIKLAGQKIRNENADKIAKRMTPLDTGFRVYKLASSNFVQWNENKAKDDIQQAVLDFAVNRKPGVAPESLLAEIMLQTRMPLSAAIEKRELENGGWVYVVDGGNLIAYVAAEQITEAQANEIADLAPAKLIVLDSAFNDNNALKINVANICKEKFVKEFKTI